MEQLCTRCHFIGHGRHGLFSGNAYIGIAQISLGLALIATNIGRFNWSEIIILIIAVISIFVGILNILDSKKPGRICPNCKKTDMILIGTEEGQKFIKENNISVPIETKKQSSPQSP